MRDETKLGVLWLMWVLADTRLAGIALGTVAEKSVAAGKVLSTVAAQEALFVAVGGGDVTVAIVLAHKAGVAFWVGLALEGTVTDVGADVRVDGRLAHEDASRRTSTLVKAASEELGLLLGCLVKLAADLVTPPEASVDDGLGCGVHQAVCQELEGRVGDQGALRRDRKRSLELFDRDGQETLPNLNQRLIVKVDWHRRRGWVRVAVDLGLDLAFGSRFEAGANTLAGHTLARRRFRATTRLTVTKMARFEWHVLERGVGGDWRRRWDCCSAVDRAWATKCLARRLWHRGGTQHRANIVWVARGKCQLRVT